MNNSIQQESATTPLLTVSHLSKDYTDGNRVLNVLSDVNLHVNPGEIISIVGFSGSGKSTLLHQLGALDRPTSGVISLLGEDLTKLNDKSLAVFRSRHIGFIFQFHHLLSEFSAIENCIIPGLILNKYGLDALHERAAQLLESLGLSDRLSHRSSQLSGGEQQRVALARALMNDPDLILADEPTGNLDTQTADTVIDLLWKNCREKNKSLIIVTHEPTIAKRADRCLRLVKGALAESE
ncbi:MAG: ABC transporter ATP-binding protein [Candidatus Sumerlaeales bacterium]|nr:ABC transporter ATP-binding protein [Candidatus Sumerlaeales bacterium]